MNVKSERIKNKLTQQELADKTEIQVRVLQRIEKENTCTVQNAIKIARALNTTVENLFSDSK